MPDASPEQSAEVQKSHSTDRGSDDGSLPSTRVNPSPPFSFCGVDYAGPFLLKKGHMRKPVLIKAYLAVFICFSTKAAHIEVVSDLTTEGFIA